jgi:hypothetical protein
MDIVTSKGCVTYRRVLYCIIGFIDTLCIQLVTTINYSAIAIFKTLHFTVTHSSVLSLLHSPLVVFWQRIHNSLTVASNHACSHLCTAYFLSCQTCTNKIILAVLCHFGTYQGANFSENMSGWFVIYWYTICNLPSYIGLSVTSFVRSFFMQSAFVFYSFV